MKAKRSTLQKFSHRWGERRGTDIVLANLSIADLRSLAASKMNPDGHERRQFITNCIRNKKDSSDIVATSLPPLALLPNPANILELPSVTNFQALM